MRRLANPAYIRRLYFSDLHALAPYCALGGVKVVSTILVIIDPLLAGVGMVHTVLVGAGRKNSDTFRPSLLEALIAFRVR